MTKRKPPDEHKPGCYCEGCKVLHTLRFCDSLLQIALLTITLPADISETERLNTIGEAFAKSVSHALNPTPWTTMERIQLRDP